jgi:hypothetical protein
MSKLPEFRMCDYTDRLSAVSGKRNTYHCPVCNGNNLEVKPDSTKYQCFNGCENAAIREIVRPLSEAIEAATPKKTIQGEERRSWIYTDIQGNNCIKVVRVDDGQGKKRIHQEFAIDGRWTTEATDADKSRLKAAVSIYRLADVRRAISKGAPIFWVEGEKCADMLWDLGLAATTTITGTAAYGKYSDYGRPLKDATVIICPDQDEPGKVYADKVFKDHPQAQWLYAFPDSPAWNHLPKDKGVDVADWIEQKKVTAIDIMSEIEPHYRGYVEPVDDWALFCNQVNNLMEISHPIEREFRLRQICASYKMPISMGKDLIEAHRGKVNKFEPIDVLDFMAQKQGDREWLIAAHIPLGAVINLCAMGGAGKTSLAYEWSKAMALGMAWNGYPAKQSNVLLIQSDEPEMDAQEKLDIQNYYELPKDRCFIFFNWISSAIGQLEDFIKAKDIKFIVIDSLAAMNLGMDRDRSEFADNLRVLRDIANANKCTFLVLDHTNKSGGNLGTIAVHNAVSEMMYLKFPTEDERRLYFGEEGHTRDYRILTWEKSRSGLKGTQFVLKQRPATYTNGHHGELERLAGGAPDRTFEFLEYFKTRQVPMNVSEFAEMFSMSFDDASAKLESMRRTGMVGGSWVVPEIGQHVGKRWRVYHSIHRVELPPDDPIEVPAMSIVESEEVFEYEYTADDF